VNEFIICLTYGIVMGYFFTVKGFYGYLLFCLGIYETVYLIDYGYGYFLYYYFCYF